MSNYCRFWATNCYKPIFWWHVKMKLSWILSICKINTFSRLQKHGMPSFLLAYCKFIMFCIMCNCHNDVILHNYYLFKYAFDEGMMMLNHSLAHKRTNMNLHSIL